MVYRIVNHKRQAWAQHYFSVIVQKFGDATFRRTVRNLHNMTASSSFSGIAGTEHACHLMKCCAKALHPSCCVSTTTSECGHRFSIEPNKECQYEIMMTPGQEDVCLFERCESLVDKKAIENVMRKQAFAFEDIEEALLRDPRSKFKTKVRGAYGTSAIAHLALPGCMYLGQCASITHRWGKGRGPRARTSFLTYVGLWHDSFCWSPAFCTRM